MRYLQVLAAILLWLTPAAAAPAPDPIAGLQSLERVVLNNGLRVLVGEPERQALFCEILLVVRAGTAIPAAGQEELAQIAAQALLAGSRGATVPPIRTELARLGVSADFTVGREVVVFRFALPVRSTAAFLQLLAELLAREPDDTTWAEAIARRTQDIAGEMSDPWQHGRKQLSELLWVENGGGAARQEIALDRAALLDFRHREYAPGGMVLSVWGGLPSDELIASVQGEFARLRRVDVEPARPIPEPVRLEGRSVRCLQDAGANPAVLLVGLGADAREDADFYGWQLVAHILGASYNSRLQHRLREEMQAVYTVEAAVIPVGARGMLLRIVGQTDQLQTTRQVVLEELKRLLRAPVAPDDLEYARALLRSRLRLDAASFRDQFYRLSLVLLSSQHVRDPLAAEALVAAFTPQSLLDLAGRTLQPDDAASVVLSRRIEPLCEAGHVAKP
jgi:predicted Zn-dependent peptidase